MSRESTLVVNQLIHDLQHRPDDFSCGEHVLRDNRTSFEYWVGIGMSGIYKPYKMTFGIIPGWRFGVALLTNATEG